MNFAFQKDLQNYLTQQLGVEVPEITAELCPEGFDGDVTVSCFPLAKALRKNPMQIAQQAGEFLSGHADVEKVEVAKAFVNITLKTAALMRDTVADETALMDSALLPAAERRKILIEFSAPNTNKPQHLGHVRNNTIGMSTAAILKRAGHAVTQVNLVNDRGIHICKSMIAYQRFGEGCTPESTGKKGDHLVGDFYVRYNQELEKQIAELRTAHPEFAEEDKDALFLKTEIGQATAKMLQDWEAEDPAVRELWQRMNSWVFDGFAQTYKRMGIKFDHLYLESQTYKLGKDIWDSDSFELFIAPGDAKPVNLYQFAIAANGHWEDFHSQLDPPRPNDADWKAAGLKVDVKRGEKEWRLDLFLPWSALYDAAPKPGDVWRMNLISNRMAPYEYDAIAPTLNANYRWKFYTRFHFVDK